MKTKNVKNSKEIIIAQFKCTESKIQMYKN